jgi:hypothetical protein
MKPLSPNEVIDLMSDLRAKFPATDSLTRALDGDAAPALLLARTARDQARQEVLSAYEEALSEATGISRGAIEAPEAEAVEAPTRPDFTSYLSEL